MTKVPVVIEYKDIGFPLHHAHLVLESRLLFLLSRLLPIFLWFQLVSMVHIQLELWFVNLSIDKSQKSLRSLGCQEH